MDSLKEIWDTVLSNIASSGEFSEATFNLWFRDLELVSLNNNFAVVDTKNQFKNDIISNRYAEILNKHLAAVLGFEVPITFEVFEETHYERVNIIEKSEEDISEREPEKKMTGEVDEDGLTHITYNASYTFENFIVGNTNKFAHAACKAIASDASHTYNPLFIYGDSGLGKTHLLYAITNEILRTRKNTTAIYVRGEDFANEMINALSKKTPMQYFRDKYRKADVLLVDDVQFIAGKSSTQEEFFHTFNTLYEDKKQIILACDRPVREIPSLEERLKTRFEWGLTAAIEPPDYELRYAILKKKAQDQELELSDDIFIFLADKLGGNIRHLECAINKLKATSMIMNAPLTFDNVRKTLQDLIMASTRNGVTVDDIFETVSRKYSIPVEDIKSKKRMKEISHARHVVMYILRYVANLPFEVIASYFNMHYSSVISACNKISNDIKLEPTLDYDINEMIKTLK